MKNLIRKVSHNSRRAPFRTKNLAANPARPPFVGSGPSITSAAAVFSLAPVLIAARIVRNTLKERRKSLSAGRHGGQNRSSGGGLASRATGIRQPGSASPPTGKEG